MVSRKGWLMSVLVLTVAMAPSLVFAAEYGGQDKTTSTTATPSDSSTSATTDISTSGNDSMSSSDTMAPTSTTTAPATMDQVTTVPSTPAPSTPPALKPIMITFSGSLAAVESKATPGSITVKDRYGVTKEIAVPSEAKVAQGTTSKTLADLKVNDNVTVEYTYDVATGKRTSQSIMIGEAAAAQ